MSAIRFPTWPPGIVIMILLSGDCPLTISSIEMDTKVCMKVFGSPQLHWTSVTFPTTINSALAVFYWRVISSWALNPKPKHGANNTLRAAKTKINAIVLFIVSSPLKSRRYPHPQSLRYGSLFRPPLMNIYATQLLPQY